MKDFQLIAQCHPVAFDHGGFADFPVLQEGGMRDEEKADQQVAVVKVAALLRLRGCYAAETRSTLG